MTGDVTVERTVLPGGAVLSTVRGAQPGPTLALLGGVHGDEDEGVLAVQRIINELTEAGFSGTGRAVAPANPQGWAAHSRTSPLDDGNLARSFPGDPGGGPTEALAAAITAEVITGADLLIDLHSAGVRYCDATVLRLRPRRRGGGTLRAVRPRVRGPADLGAPGHRAGTQPVGGVRPGHPGALTWKALAVVGSGATNWRRTSVVCCR